MKSAAQLLLPTVQRLEDSVGDPNSPAYQKFKAWKAQWEAEMEKVNWNPTVKRKSWPVK